MQRSLPGWHLPALPTTLARLLLLRNSQAGRKEKRRQNYSFQNETYLKHISLTQPLKGD
jgi:hypothetical protein